VAEGVVAFFSKLMDEDAEKGKHELTLGNVRICLPSEVTLITF
jgi:hypothetical protein